MKILASLLLLSAPAVFAAPEIADAAEHRDGAGVKALLAKKVDVNATQPDGSTALLWAVHWNDADTVKSLLAAGADPK